MFGFKTIMKVSATKSNQIFQPKNHLYINKYPNTHRSNISFGQWDEKKFNSAWYWKCMRNGDFGFWEDIKDFNPNFTEAKTGIPLLAAIYNPSILGKMQFSIDFWYVNKLKRKDIDKIIFHTDFDPLKEYFDIKKGCKRNYFTDAVHNNDTYILKQLFKSCREKGIKINKQLYDCLLDMTELKKRNKIKDILDKYQNLVDDDNSNDTPQSMLDMIKNPQKSNHDKPLTQATIERPQKVDIDTKIPKPSSKNIQFPNAPATLDDLGGMQEAKEIINEFIILPWSSGVRDKLKKNNISMPNGFLMYGPPGCGKTYITSVIANQTGFSMYNIDLATIGGQLAYETQNRLKKLFTELEANYKETGKPNILFLDEIDSIAASRKIGHTDWKKDEINALISLINNVSEKGIILIGATNLLENVDAAVLRPGRFDKKLYIGLPDKKSRKDIFDKMIRKIPIAQELAEKTDTLAELTKGKSNAEISAALNECCREALCHDKETVSLKDFKRTMENLEALKQENSEKKAID